MMVVVNESEAEALEAGKSGSASPVKSRYYRVEKRYSDFLALHNDVSDGRPRPLSPVRFMAYR